MKLILIKHTSTDWDDSGRIKGQTDVGLNATGRDEARHLAERLRDFKIELIVSSDLSRARETAEIIRAALGVGAPVRLESNLHECSVFGRFLIPSTISWMRSDSQFARTDLRNATSDR